MTLDLSIATAIWVVVLLQFALIALRRKIDRDDARRNKALRNLAEAQHDLACKVATWPHPGTCEPADTEGGVTDALYISRWMMLAQAATQGVGLLPLFMLDRMAVPSPGRTEPECNGCD